MGAGPDPARFPSGDPVSFLTRFQRLERSRSRSDAPRAPTGERFEAIEPAAPLPEVHPGGLARFAPAAPPADAPLELAPRGDAQPFVRCPACGVDSAPGTHRCACGTALDTIQAVAFNTELWDRHRAEQALHQERRVRTREAELESAAELQRERRAMGEAIAREIALREGRGSSGVGSRFAGALLLLGFLALVLLPRGPVARFLFALLLGAVAVRAVVAWVRFRGDGVGPQGPPSVDD